MYIAIKANGDSAELSAARPAYSYMKSESNKRNCGYL